MPLRVNKTNVRRRRRRWPGIKTTTIPDMIDSKFYTPTAQRTLRLLSRNGGLIDYIQPTRLLFDVRVCLSRLNEKGLSTDRQAVARVV